MTVREIYEAVLVEINKENAPTFTIEEFNYLLNKAILAFTNEKYNFYATNQQLSDDLRVLIKTSRHNTDIPSTFTWNRTRAVALEIVDNYNLTVSSASDFKPGDTFSFEDGGTSFLISNITPSSSSAYPYAYNIEIVQVGTLPSDGVGKQLYIRTDPVPVTTEYALDDFGNDEYLDFELSTADYLHVLSCRLIEAGSKYSHTAGAIKQTFLTFPARRVTFDMLNFIENNPYLRPAKNRPYFQVFDNENNFSITKYTRDDPNAREYQNKPKFRVYTGRASKVLKPYEIRIDYIKMPDPVILDDLDLFTAGEDSSQVLEFPDYLKNEFVKRVSVYLLEKSGNPRFQTQPALNQEIPAVPMNMQQAAQVQGATPAQQQQAQQQ